MLLLGYVFLRNNGFRRQLDNIDTLFVGGDTRCGLGEIRRVGWQEVYADLSVFWMVGTRAVRGEGNVRGLPAQFWNNQWPGRSTTMATGCKRTKAR